jgi:hypothetical protein
LTGAQRTANVITEEDSEFLIIPSRVMKRLAQDYEEVRDVFQATMQQRISQMEMPRGQSFDQQLLRELRTSVPDVGAVQTPA